MFCIFVLIRFFFPRELKNDHMHEGDDNTTVYKLNN